MASKKKSTENVTLRRHGDIVLQALTAEQAAEIAAKVQAEKANPNRRYDGKVLAYGEVTGHAHRVRGDAEIARLEKALTILEVPQRAPLSHEEHKTINLPAGFFAFTQKRQYNAENEQGWEAVQD